MSFKEWFTGLLAPAKDKPADKPKDVPVASQPVAQPDKTPAEVAPASKS